METRKLPIGIDSFEKLRTEGFYYVDKSLLIRDLLNGWSEVNLFTRPRRFGKTLNMSMLKSFFEIGCKKSLFDGLAIADEKKLCDEYMGKFPVVFVSLKGVDGDCFDYAYEMLRGVIRDEAFRLQYLKESDRLSEDEKRAFARILSENDTRSDITESLKTLTRLLEKHYSQKAILLIDEYDVPLDKAYQHGYYDEMITLIRTMFGAALKTNDSLYFAVMTGCLRVSKESIFTGLNNLKVYSIADTQFNESFGFTDTEVEKLLRDYGMQDHHAEAKEWYDGYRFGKQDVYCPWDVINYCHDLRADNDMHPLAYWINTSSNEMVRRLINKANTGTARREIEQLIAGQPIYKTLNNKLTHNEIDKDINNIWSLLFMTGYLTMKAKPRNGSFELVIPNKEVRQIYIEQIQQWFNDKAQAETDMLSAFFAAFESGDVNCVQETLNKQLITTISFYDAQESFYHGFLLALLNTCADWQVTSNAETGKGRSDIISERVDGKLGFVVEVKAVKDPEKLSAACDAAIRQIEEKDYTATLRRYRVGDIWIYGIAFCDKECRVSAKHLA